MRTPALLGEMVGQFVARHKRWPDRIVLTPLACLAMAIKGSLTPYWGVIPVECREIAESEATRDEALAKSLAIFAVPEGRKSRLLSCDLKT
jgi:hypothetical protein